MNGFISAIITLSLMLFVIESIDDKGVAIKSSAVLCRITTVDKPKETIDIWRDAA